MYSALQYLFLLTGIIVVGFSSQTWGALVGFAWRVQADSAWRAQAGFVSDSAFQVLVAQAAL